MATRDVDVGDADVGLARAAEDDARLRDLVLPPGDGQRDDLALRLGRRRVGDDRRRAPCRSSSGRAARSASDGGGRLRPIPRPATRRVAMPNSPTARSSSTRRRARAVRPGARSARGARARRGTPGALRRAPPRSPANCLRSFGREVDRVLVRDVDARDGDAAVVVHLLHELARQLDRLDVRAEGATEDAFEQALDLRFDGAQDSHGRASRRV